MGCLACLDSRSQRPAKVSLSRDRVGWHHWGGTNRKDEVARGRERKSPHAPAFDLPRTRPVASSRIVPLVIQHTQCSSKVKIGASLNVCEIVRPWLGQRSSGRNQIVAWHHLNEWNAPSFNEI